MKRIVARLLIALVLGGSVSLAVPAGAQSHGGHHGTGGHHRVLHSSARDVQVQTGALHHGHRSIVHHHMHSSFWSPRLASRCDRLGWSAHDHHWRSAFDYYGFFDRVPGAECVQDGAGRHW